MVTGKLEVAGALNKLAGTSGLEVAGATNALLNKLAVVGPTQPSAPATNALWYDTGSEQWKRWGGSAWQTTNPSTLGFGGTTRVEADATGLGFFGVTPVAQAAHIADPSGGVTSDAQARDAIDSILDLLQTYGLMAAP